ncbi:hypothetical protein [Paenibacillus kobensis]|uniref:hypothetical protein n=1 Tax=Paenibacillus kobensis TaxID=59841 RepID=UPI000FDA9227|nr:hypothetical protein [Paenibacillus kobensis]
MPTNKREDFYFGLMMVTGMVIVMTFYNLYNHGLIGTASWAEIGLQLLAGFVVAFVLELFVVGPAAKKAAFLLPYDKSKKGLVIVSLALCMVLGMVTVMSLFGLAMSHLTGNAADEPLLASYGSLWIRNFLFALPLQLIVMGPLVRFLFAKFVQGRFSNASVEGRAA